MLLKENIPIKLERRKPNRIIFYSLFINLILLTFNGLFIYRQGGLYYLLNKISPPAMSSGFNNINSPTYRSIKDMYIGLPGKDAAIVFAGDSITYYCQWNELLQLPVLNRGISNETTEGMQRRIGEILRHHPKQLFIMVGINDLKEGKKPEQVLADYQLLIKNIKLASPNTQIFLQSILPVNVVMWRSSWGEYLRAEVIRSIPQVNQGLEKLADGKQVIYIDLYSAMAVKPDESTALYSKIIAEPDQLNQQYTFDGIHLNAEGYIKWRNIVRPYVKS
jgi:lysophospholipase L1-like esterase